MMKKKKLSIDQSCSYVGLVHFYNIYIYIRGSGSNKKMQVRLHLDVHLILVGSKNPTGGVGTFFFPRTTSQNQHTQMKVQSVIWKLCDDQRCWRFHGLIWTFQS